MQLVRCALNATTGNLGPDCESMSNVGLDGPFEIAFPP